MKKVLGLAAFSLISLFGQANAEAVFGIDQYLALKGVSELSASPDGLYVAYTVTSSDLKKDTTRDIVWMLPTSGGDPVQVLGEPRAVRGSLKAFQGRQIQSPRLSRFDGVLSPAAGNRQDAGSHRFHL